MPRRDASRPRTAINVGKLIRRIEHRKPSVDDDRRAMIMEILLSKDEITRAEIIDMFGLHPGSIQLLIGCLLEEGLMERVRYGTYSRGEYYATYWKDIG